jgi:hypothetical protein
MDNDAKRCKAAMLLFSIKRAGSGKMDFYWPIPCAESANKLAHFQRPRRDSTISPGLQQQAFARHPMLSLFVGGV